MDVVDKKLLKGATEQRTEITCEIRICAQDYEYIILCPNIVE
jgi:hypothetical protein